MEWGNKSLFIMSGSYDQDCHHSKQSPNMLENQARSQNSAYTTRKSLIFRVLRILFAQIPLCVNRDSLKNPTLCGAKTGNKLPVPSHLIT